MPRFQYAASLAPLMVGIDEVQQHPGNPNNGDLDTIVESIQTHGFIEAISVQRSTGYIISGNHRYAAALSLGATEIPVVWVDCDEEEAYRILLHMNRSARLGRDDPAMVLEILDSLHATERGLIGTGYDEQNLDWLRESLEGPLVLDDGDEEYAKQRSAHVCVCRQCGWRSDDKQRSTDDG